ncbi:MAG TPA: hypothetical protein VF230_05915 [Acidimicrobiales bacterium]
MRRYLVVANDTLLGLPLTEEVRRRVEDAGGECHVHLVVPATHGHGAWTEGGARARAARQLEHGEARYAGLGGAVVTGEVGDPSPVLAVGDAMLASKEPFDEVLVSTLALGRSRWLKQDVIHRLQRAHPDLRITHVAATPAGAVTGGARSG